MRRFAFISSASRLGVSAVLVLLSAYGRMALAVGNAADETIPALPTSPRLTLPFRAKYVDVAAILVVAGIMCWRDHRAEHCWLVKRFTRSWWP